MAFFASSSNERLVKRSVSTDRLRGARPQPARSSKHNTSTQKYVGADEFGMIIDPNSNDSPTVASASLHVPSPSLSTTSRGRNSPNGSGNGSSRTGSRSPNPSRRRAALQEHSTGEASSAHSLSPSPAPSYVNEASNSSSSKKAERDHVSRARSSPDLKDAPKSRSRMRSNEEQSTDIKTPIRPPRGPRPQSPSLSRPTQLNTTNISAATAFPGHSPASHSHSSSSSSPLTPAPNNTTRQRSSPSTASGPVIRRDDALTLPIRTTGSKPPCGNVSDGSYGSPLSEGGGMELSGMGFSMKRLLSRPADTPSISSFHSSHSTTAQAQGRGAVRSEPDTEYGYNSLARRCRLDTSPIPHSPSVYSVSGASLNERTSRRAGSESENMTFGSLGRSRGLEWGHVLSKLNDSDKDNGAHVRQYSSSFSLSSPSEGANPYPISLALERERAALRANAKTMAENGRPLIQLTTSAVRRFSALGARDLESPGTTITYATQSPASVSAASTPSTSLSSRPNPNSRNGQREPMGVTRRADSPPPVGLTPAEIVAHTYKQQEKRRAELEQNASDHPEKFHERSQRTIRAKDRDKDKERGKISMRDANVITMSEAQSSIRKPGDIEEGGGDGGNNASDALSYRGHDPDEASAPYYTVFGNPEGRIVAIGNGRDSAFGLFERVQEKAKATEKAVIAEMTSTSITTGTSVNYVNGKADDKSGSPMTLRRKLSRKMSGKFRKDVFDGRERALSDPVEEKEERTSGRPSLSLNTTTTSSGRRSATIPRERPGQVSRRNSLKMSLDSFVAVPSLDPSSGMTLPTAANGSSKSFASRHNHVYERERKTSDSSLRPKQKSDKMKTEKEKEQERADKGKFWGLVKRISSNTLKDKYRPSVSDIPPVPALPRDHSSVEVGDLHTGPRKLKATRPSLSHSRRPSTAPMNSLSPVEGRFILRKKASVSQTLSIAESDVDESCQPASSTSEQIKRLSAVSLNDASAASNKYSIGEHILPPEKLYMFGDLNFTFGENEEPKSPIDSTGLFYGESNSSHQALPVPPRRAGQLKLDDDSRSASPTIPTFSADNPINTFGFRNRSGTTTTARPTPVFPDMDFGEMPKSTDSLPLSRIASSSEPPPRPPRSTRRGPAAPSISQSSHSSHSPDPSIAKITLGDRGSIGRVSQASTARPNTPHNTGVESPSSSPPPLLDSQSPISMTDSNSSSLTFRDLSAPGGKVVWSEKEKLDKWDELLDRSERAGGTLHVGFGGLMSDHLRESTFEPTHDTLSLYSEF